MFTKRRQPGVLLGLRWLIGFATLFLATILLASRPAKADEESKDLSRKARAVLATLEGQIAVPGLGEPVEVLRDRWGVAAHLREERRRPVLRPGLRRRAGPPLPDRPVAARSARRRDGRGPRQDRASKATASPGCSGTAATWTPNGPATRRTPGRSRPPSRAASTPTSTTSATACPSSFSSSASQPKKWQPEDVLGRMSGIIMTRNFQQRGRPRRACRRRRRREGATGRRRPIRRGRYAPAPGLDLAGIDRAILAGYEAASKPLPFSAAGDGSNNWVVDGTLSASGKPLLASDPHRAIALPSLRYLVHLHAPGWNVDRQRRARPARRRHRPQRARRLGLHHRRHRPGRPLRRGDATRPTRRSTGSATAGRR